MNTRERERDRQQKPIQNGIEKTFTQIEWQNIYFDTLNVELNTNKLPTNNFYNKFYEELFRKYKNFESLPKNWLLAKQDTAINISKEVIDNQAVLSYGCGIGYVEKVLAEINPTLEVFTFDFSDDASKWIKNKFTEVTHQTNLEANKKFDLIYLCQVLYALSYSDCVELIKKLSTHLKPNGKILLINTSITPLENGHIDPTQTLKTYLKNIIRPIYRTIFPISKNHKEQFWGWQRDNNKFCEMAIEANMNIHKCYSASKQSFILLAKSN